MRKLLLVSAMLCAAYPFSARAADPDYYRYQTFTFNSSRETWLAPGTSKTQFNIWQSTGGNPGGYLQTSDLATGTTPWQFTPTDPSRFSNTQQPSYLRLDLKSSSPAGDFFASDWDIKLQRMDTLLLYNAGIHPTTDWATYQISMDPASGWMRYYADDDIRPATQHDIDVVLSRIDDFQIRGNYTTGIDTISFDNLQWVVTPEPATWITAAIGGAALALIGRRRSRRGAQR